jgi:hypothetical protein
MAYISFQPSDYFNTKLYTGNGSTNAITGVGFQPDWVWIKRRDGTNTHNLFDAVRGATKALESNETLAEQTLSTALTAFDSDGFTLGSGGDVNGSSASQVSWNWKANGSGSANTDGSTSSTVSANQTAGFSIVKYTNPSSGSPFTVGHGLGAAPKMIIIKNLSSAQTWGVYHASVGFGKYLRLDDTAAEASANLVTATSATTFSAYQDHHSTGNELIAYCFAEKKGFSKFGSYTGNGNNDGSFIYLGFRPAWVMIKRTNTAEGWYIIDSKRTGFNEANYALIAQGSSAEETGTNRINLLSNGFKATTSNTAVNGSSDNYIYMAFAEAPLISSNGVPATAR